MRIVRLFRTLLIVLGIGVTTPALAAENRLPSLGADPAKTSISGLSSGAFMAIQYDVAFSASTIGVGVVAGGPYNCAYVNGPVVTANLFTCMSGSPIGAQSYEAALGFASLGQIDDPDHLKTQKVYLFSGTKDQVVKQTAMNAVLQFFEDAHVPKANVQYVKTVPAGHAFISAHAGGACSVNATPYVNQCSVGGQLYDQPQAILTRIYGPLQPKAATLSSAPIPFDQTEFTLGVTDMAKTGYVYVPAACAQGGAGKCAVHVVFHGCTQSADQVGDMVYAKVGYNEWADSNRIIVLYPQVDAQANAFAPGYNPEGCWDWWGYSGLNFQTQAGPQLSAVRAMVQRLQKP